MTERIKKLESTIPQLKGCINIDKKAIKRYEWELRALKAEQQLRDMVKHDVAEQYAKFCVICDRKKLPLINLKDYLRQL